MFTSSRRVIEWRTKMIKNQYLDRCYMGRVSSRQWFVLCLAHMPGKGLGASLSDFGGVSGGVRETTRNSARNVS